MVCNYCVERIRIKIRNDLFLFGFVFLLRMLSFSITFVYTLLVQKAVILRSALVQVAISGNPVTVITVVVVDGAVVRSFGINQGRLVCITRVLPWADEGAGLGVSIRHYHVPIVGDVVNEASRICLWLGLHSADELGQATGFVNPEPAVSLRVCEWLSACAP